MKKTFVLLLVFALLCSSVAYATEIDLSSYTDEEIVALLAQVQNEVVNRHIEKTATLPMGTYITGKDIPAGNYVYAITVVDAETYGDGYLSGIVSIRSIKDAEDEYPSKLFELVRNTEEFVCYISLEKGDTFISPVPFTLTISSGVMFK